VKTNCKSTELLRDIDSYERALALVRKHLRTSDSALERNHLLKQETKITESLMSLREKWNKHLAKSDKKIIQKIKRARRQKR